MLGALLSRGRFPLSYEATAKAIETVGKPALLEKNLLSLSKGREYGRSWIKDRAKIVSKNPRSVPISLSLP